MKEGRSADRAAPADARPRAHSADSRSSGVALAGWGVGLASVAFVAGWGASPSGVDLFALLSDRTPEQAQTPVPIGGAGSTGAAGGGSVAALLWSRDPVSQAVSCACAPVPARPAWFVRSALPKSEDPCDALEEAQHAQRMASARGGAGDELELPDEPTGAGSPGATGVSPLGPFAFNAPLAQFPGVGSSGSSRSGGTTVAAAGGGGSGGSSGSTGSTSTSPTGSQVNPTARVLSTDPTGGGTDGAPTPAPSTSLSTTPVSPLPPEPAPAPTNGGTVITPPNTVPEPDAYALMAVAGVMAAWAARRRRALREAASPPPAA